MKQAIAVTLVLTLTQIAPVTAAPVAGTLEGCGEDIDCWETFYMLSEQTFLHGLAATRTVGPGAEACMQANIDAWTEAVKTACLGNACVEAASWDRLAALAPLQPEVNRITSWDLPEVAELVAVLGPETGAGAQDSGAELDIAGSLVLASGHPEHMGIAIDAGDGVAHVVTFDMDIGNQPGHQTLLSLIGAAPDMRFHVSGTAQMAADGIANFDTEQCRYIYRLPD